MSLIVRSSLSLEFVKIPVSFTELGVVVDPTGFPVEMAFKLNHTEPDEADWQVAEWETAGGKYLARVLVGPGGAIELENGVYTIWVRITSDPEIPVIDAGDLQVT